MASHTTERILIAAPTGADAQNIQTVLGNALLRTVVCRTLDEVARLTEKGAGSVLVTEEALMGNKYRVLSAALGRQPPWSDLPLLVVTSSGSMARWAIKAPVLLGNRSNVVLIARPLQAVTLVAAVNAVLRARRRQYQVRDLLSERDTLLASLDKRVRERTVKLQELVSELDTFSYSVSHDLRAPLRVMSGYAQIILDDYKETLRPEVCDYVERIARSARKMDQLTQDVLTYTRLSRGDMVLAPLDLESTVRDLLESYPDLVAARRAITVRGRLAPVIAHAPSLAQALSNLVENALKFARPGVAARVQISTKVYAERVRVVVKDNGIGIARIHQRKIFRMFERVGNATVPGTGIGLTIVKKAAERMGGTVGVNSRPGEGSEFWIELQKAAAT